MKTTLTIEQSQKLIELGVDAKLASEREFVDKTERDSNQFLEIEEYPLFSLTDLLSILAKEIDYNGLTYGLNMWVNKAVWYLEYVAEVKFNQWDALNTDNFESSELIDSLYQLAIYCLENGHLKTEKI